MLSTGLRTGFESYITREDGSRYSISEHKVEGLPLSTVCYLESEEEKQFTIHFDGTAEVEKLYPKHDWIIAFRVDGRLILQLAHRKGVIGVQCSELHSEEERKIVEGRLVFAKVRTTDDDNQVTLEKEAKLGLGEIRVDIYDGRYEREVAWTKPVLAKTDVGIAKESKGERIGCTSITSKTPYCPSKEAKEVKFAYNDPSRPFFSFVFVHRSRLALQAMNVIPADPENQIHVVPRKRKSHATGVIVIDGSDEEEEGEQGNESSDSETDEMERRMAELERKLRRANQRNRRARIVPEDALDLTGDD